MGRSTVGASAFGRAFNADRVFSHLLGSAIGDLLSDGGVSLPRPLRAWVFDAIDWDASVIRLVECFQAWDFGFEYRNSHFFKLFAKLRAVILRRWRDFSEEDAVIGSAFVPEHLHCLHKPERIEAGRYGGDNEQMAALREGIEIRVFGTLACIDDRVSEFPRRSEEHTSELQS